MRLCAVLILAVLPVLASLVAQNNATLGGGDRRRMRVPAERIRALDTELAERRGLWPFRRNKARSLRSRGGGSGSRGSGSRLRLRSSDSRCGSWSAVRLVLRRFRGPRAIVVPTTASPATSPAPHTTPPTAILLEVAVTLEAAHVAVWREALIATKLSRRRVDDAHR